MRILFIPLLAALGLTGCATEIMTEKECLVGDWYGAGLEDGGYGRLESAFDERADQCIKYGTAIDATSYREGRQAALSRLCTEEGGYTYGREGNVYRGVCAANRESGFLAGYLSGRRIFGVELIRNDAQEIYNEAASAVDYQFAEIRRARDVLANEQSTSEEMEEARRKVDYARDARARAERERDDALYELGRADEALDQTIFSSASWRASDDFYQARQTLMEAHSFARADRAIDHCTDELGSFIPTCLIYPGASLRDHTSARTCVLGPGDARFSMRQNQSATRDGYWTHYYEYFPGEVGSGRRSRRPTGGFTVLFEAGEGADFVGVSCAGPYAGQ